MSSGLRIRCLTPRQIYAQQRYFPPPNATVSTVTIMAILHTPEVTGPCVCVCNRSSNVASFCCSALDSLLRAIFERSSNNLALNNLDYCCFLHQPSKLCMQLLIGQPHDAIAIDLIDLDAIAIGFRCQLCSRPFAGIDLLPATLKLGTNTVICAALFCLALRQRCIGNFADLFGEVVRLPFARARTSAETLRSHHAIDPLSSAMAYPTSCRFRAGSCLRLSTRRFLQLSLACRTMDVPCVCA